MIIGITGTFAAGKGTLVDHLIKRGFKHYSARELITKEIEHRGLPVDRDSMIEVANDLRAKHGPAYIIESLFNEAEAGGGDAVIESIREIAGAEFLKEQGGILLAIDADRRVRYDRAFGRKSETDRVTFEKFSEQEDRELASDDPNKQNLAAVIDMADYYLLNNGSREALGREIDALLAKLGI